MNTKDFIKLVAVKSKIESNTVEKVLNAVTESITDLLTRGISPIYINNFGGFGFRIVEERVCRNPKTGQLLTIPPTCYVYFKPSDVLKQKLKEKSIVTDSVKTVSTEIDEDELLDEDFEDMEDLQEGKKYFSKPFSKNKVSMPVGVL